MEEEDCVEDITILQKDDNAMAEFKNKQNSQPNQNKVAAFKNRVFSLLLLFVEKAKDLSSILPLLTEETFMKDPERIRQILTGLINKSALPSDRLLEIAQLYKKLLLFKNKKDANKFAQDFINILRKLKAEKAQSVKQIAEEMLEMFIVKRKCKLNISFFSYLLKKIPGVRQNIISKAVELQHRQGVRPAQQRVLEKLLKNLVKNKGIKVEHEEQEEAA